MSSVWEDYIIQNPDGTYKRKSCSEVEAVGSKKAVIIKPKKQNQYQSGIQNRTELYYEQHKILPAFRTGDVVWYRFEPLKFILCHGIKDKVNEMSYKIDFLVAWKDKIQAIEVKPINKKAIHEDSIVKLKSAVEMFPIFEFVKALVDPKSGKIIEEVLN